MAAKARRCAEAKNTPAAAGMLTLAPPPAHHDNVHGSSRARVLAQIASMLAWPAVVGTFGTGLSINAFWEAPRRVRRPLAWPPVQIPCCDLAANGATGAENVL